MHETMVFVKFVKIIGNVMYLYKLKNKVNNVKIYCN